MTDLLKKCPRCKQKSNRANFKSNGYCSTCASEYQANMRADTPKLCLCCEEEKPRSAFSKKRGCVKCKECVIAHDLIRRALTAEERANHMAGFSQLMQSWLVRRWV